MGQQHTTVGVIGHVDHGKSALVRALTGIETDRLEEEKRRGMSIALGFAWLEREEVTIDFIDVPGHENFIRTMVAGASGIDAVLLVVDACEGVMPQTREHLVIAELLGINRGVIAITKSDLADATLLALCRADIAEATQGTFLQHAPVTDTSAATGHGLPVLADRLRSLAQRDRQQAILPGWYLPVDRCFSVDGFGTVVTGTLRRGLLRVDDPVEIAPAGQQSAVRSLQVHGEPVQCAAPGQRVAVNLRGVAQDALERGDTLCQPDSLGVSDWLDVALVVPDCAPPGIANSATLRLLIGTRDISCRLRLLDGDTCKPGGQYLAQLHCAEPVAACFDEHFVLRAYSPAATVAGGRVLLTRSQRRRRFDSAVLQLLSTLRSTTIVSAVDALAQVAGVDGVDIDELARQLGVPVTVIEQVARRADLHTIGRHVVTAATFAACCAELLDVVTRFHRDQPAAPGMAASALQSHGQGWAEWLFTAALKTLQTDGRLCVDAGRLRLAAHDSRGGLSDAQRKLVVSIEQAYRGALFTPPDHATVCADSAARKQMLQWLLEQKLLRTVRCSETGRTLIFHAAAITEAVEQIAAAYPPPQRFRVGDVRALLGTTRKYLLPLLGYLDSQGVTLRDGDYRVLRQR